MFFFQSKVFGLRHLFSLKIVLHLIDLLCVSDGSKMQYTEIIL